MKRIIFALLIVIPFYTNAQSKTFHLGLKAEFYGYTLHEVRDYKTYSKKFSFSPLPSMYILVVKDISQSISLILKPGLLFLPESFNGLELGLGLTDKIFQDKVFIESGLNMHLVNGKPGHFEITSKTIYFIFLGVGYQLLDRIYMDICFHQTLNNEYGYTYAAFPSDASGPSKLYNMLKLGLAASF
jgi:hypothetical protein